MSTDADDLKRQAASAAAALVESGMLLGLGTGSTAAAFVEELGARLARGELSGLRAVPTSEATSRQATRLGIPLVELPPDGLDLAVDGMDELSPDLDAVKGLGGALLREKIVAAAARRFVLIGDASKLVARLGERAPVPVEVARFGWRRTAHSLSQLADATLRVVDGEPFVSDNGNHIVDCRFDAPFAPDEVARELDALPGVLGHGLFLGMAHEALVAGPEGVKRLLPAGEAGAARDGATQGSAGRPPLLDAAADARDVTP